MRAATAIVGAIAAASIMIALAFILSDGGASEGGTTTIEKVVEAPEEPAPASEGSGGATAGIGGPRQCAGGSTVENTSCQIGEQVHTEYETGHPGDIFVKDQETGSTLTFVCKSETAPITCRGEEGEFVYFGG